MPEQEIPRQIKALRDGGGGDWALRGLAVLQPLLFCTACFSWKNNTAALLPEVAALCLVCSHHPLFPSFPISQVEQLKIESKLSELCWALSPARSQRCAGTVGMLRPLFPQQPHRQDGRSASLPGWAPSWWFSPITLMKWIIFKWHFHTVQAQSVGQRAFASTCFAPALRDLHWQSPPSPSCSWARIASQWVHRSITWWNISFTRVSSNSTCLLWISKSPTDQTIDRLKYAVHCKEINLCKREQLVELIKRPYRVNWAWERH